MTREAPICHPPETILTAKECAAWLGVSRRTFATLDVPTIVVGERNYRYLAADVLDWLKERRVA